MKKLMIIAAVALAAIVSNAAEVNWKWTSTLYDHANSDAAFNGTVYIVNYNSYSQQTVLNALLGGGNLEDYGMSSITTSNGKAPSGYQLIGGSSTFKPTRVDAGTGLTMIDFYYAALTTDADGNSYVFLGTTNDATLDSTMDTHLSKSLSASKVSFESETFGSQGWYKMESGSVPEPTSGLLLLLGVAGLALRRRRA